MARKRKAKIQYGRISNLMRFKSKPHYAKNRGAWIKYWMEEDKSIIYSIKVAKPFD